MRKAGRVARKRRKQPNRRQPENWHKKSAKETLHYPDDPLVFEFKGDRIIFKGFSSAAVVALDPTTDPKCLDFRPREGFGVLRKDVAIESVYKLEGDTLSWAIYIGRDKNRPLSFETPRDDKSIVVVLSRLKA